MPNRTSTLLTAAVLLLLNHTGAQKPPAVKPDPALKETLKKLQKQAFDRKAEHDSAARATIATIADLEKRGPKLHAKDRAAFARTLGKILTSRRCKRDALLGDAVRALGSTGKYGGGALWKAFGMDGAQQKFAGKNWIALRSQMLEQLGRCKDERQIGNLMDTALRHRESLFMARAGGALRHFENSKHAVRRDKIVKDLIKRFAEVYDNSQAPTQSRPGQPSQQQAFQRMYASISGPWTVTLQRLTRQRIETTAGWTRFWNRHKSDRSWEPRSRKKRKKK